MSALEYDFESLSKEKRYKLLCGFVAPRPIALVTTASTEGVGNAAPFSFFNVFGDEPPILILGIQAKPDGTPKDTTANIRATGEFVVHLVDGAMARQMVDCAIDFPTGVNEITATGLTAVPSRKVRPMRIVEAPAALECRLTQSIEYPGRSIFVGQVLNMWVRDDCIDPSSLHVLPETYHPLARLHADCYLVADNLFELKKQPLENFRARSKESEVLV
ncbi:flavin reductase family protein [Shumkonia mesophila]|uniref:flavin reductase family protein n=1 Tax=Shumkonia mesophila TaxID=2838854 RepID=UPI0029353173|nr:flavin reductase family protein [Shumkonia mesophila]